eukprot:1253834-Alexandrium_andersonii.AAC.1
MQPSSMGEGHTLRPQGGEVPTASAHTHTHTHTPLLAFGLACTCTSRPHHSCLRERPKARREHLQPAAPSS